MPRRTNGTQVNLLEAIKTHPDWAETRIRLLKHALFLIKDTVEKCIYALEQLDDVEFNPQTNEFNEED